MKKKKTQKKTIQIVSKLFFKQQFKKFKLRGRAAARFGLPTPRVDPENKKNVKIIEILTISEYHYCQCRCNCRHDDFQNDTNLSTDENQSAERFIAIPSQYAN